MVAGHDDRPKKFLPGHVLFLTSQNIGGKVFLFVILQKDKNQRSTGEDWLFVQEWGCAWPVNMTSELGFWPDKLPLWLDIVFWLAIIVSPEVV